jgi:hypothetical protein
VSAPASAPRVQVAAAAPAPRAVPSLAVPVLAASGPIPDPVAATVVSGPSPRPRFSSSSFSGSLSFFPCPAFFNGVRCPRGSFVHAPYCRFHLRSVLKLDVDTSTIPGAGRGLFSLISRPAGSRLVEYFGEVLDAAENNRRYPKDTLGVYCLEVFSDCFIDSALFRGVGAMANAPPSGGRANVRFVASTATKSARLEVVRHIRAGDEIFVPYGRNYWKDAGAPYSTVDVPDWEWDMSDPFAALSPAPAAPLIPLIDPAVYAPMVSAVDPVPATTLVCPADAEFVPFSLPPGQATSCLSPGPAYDGPEPDPALMVWPLSAQPDWPISDAFRDFAFDTVVLRTRSPSPLREGDDSFSAS